MAVLVVLAYVVALGLALRYKPVLARWLVGLGVVAVVVAGAAFVTLLVAIGNGPMG